MAAVITPRGSAANAVPHNASNPPTDLPYIKVVGGKLCQNRGTARQRLASACIPTAIGTSQDDAKGTAAKVRADATTAV